MKNGFTLAELLLALVILGVIATFTIPKVLQSQQSSEWKAKTKEVAGMISGALDAYRQQVGISSSTRLRHLTPYMNYVKVETVGVFDGAPGDGTDYACSAPSDGICLRLHNGAMINVFDEPGTCGLLGESLDDYTWIGVDPDGKDGPNYDSVWFLMNARGRIKTWGMVAGPETSCGGGAFGAINPANDPSWFNWN